MTNNKEITEAISMVETLYPSEHAFSKRYVLRVLFECLRLTT